MMKNCGICGKRIDHDDPVFLYHSAKGDEDVHACAVCEEQFNILLDSSEPVAVKKAINYFYAFAKQTNDNELRDYLSEVIKNNASAVNDLLEAKKKTPSQEKPRDYFRETRENDQGHDGTSDGWITGMRIFAWIAFIAIIVAGILLSIPYFKFGEGGVGFAVILASFIVAFLTTGCLMIFLNMAGDIRAIRRAYDKQKKP